MLQNTVDYAEKNNTCRTLSVTTYAVENMLEHVHSASDNE